MGIWEQLALKKGSALNIEPKLRVLTINHPLLNTSDPSFLILGGFGGGYSGYSGTVVVAVSGMIRRVGRYEVELIPK